MWRNVVERGRLQMTIWRMHIACWVPKATNTPTQYVIHITFPPQQQLHDLASTLHYMYIAWLVVTETVYCAVRTRYLNKIRSVLLFMVAPCLRRLDAGFSSRRRRLETASVRVDFWWTEWHWDRTVSQYFSFHLLVSVTRRAKGQFWEPSREQFSYGNRGESDRKILSLGLCVFCVDLGTNSDYFSTQH